MATRSPSVEAPTPPSPGLTDTSATLDQYFDLDALLDEAAPASGAGAAPSQQDTAQIFGADDAFALEPLAAMQQADTSAMDASELYRLIMQGAGAPAKDATPFDFGSLPPLSTPASTAIDPSLVQMSAAADDFVVPSAAPLEPIREAHERRRGSDEDDDEDEEDDAMDEDDRDEYREAEAAPRPAASRASRRPSGATADAAVAGRRTTRGASKAAGKGKGKAAAAAGEHKPSVSELAMPVADSVQPVASTSHGKLPHMAFDVPDYIDRPPPEVYKSMNSKEKRQLRNKISARNFRHRRKEYIGALEEEIAQRDHTIAVMRDEMGALRTENGDLKRDVDLLKQQFEAALAKIGLGSAAAAPSTTASSAASSTASPAPASPLPLQSTTNMPSAGSGTLRRGRSSASTLALPNLAKDVSANWGPGGFSGITRNLGVHHTILPEHRMPLDEKPRHLNPLLAGLEPLRDLAPYTDHLCARGAAAGPPAGLHDDFFAGNPTALDGAAAEQYRGQLYQKIAHNLAGLHQGARDDAGRRTFAAGFRPAFFTEPTAAELAGKQRASPSASRGDDDDEAARERAEVAVVAGHAATTLFRRMTAAFWDAFSGPTAAKDVADVLGGRAAVRVVPVAPASPTVAPPTIVDGVVERLSSLRVGETMPHRLEREAPASP